MSFVYEFANLCGSVYQKGNVIFTPDGNALLTPVANRVTVYDLVANRSRTLPFQCRSDIRLLTLHPGGQLLLCTDVDGYTLVCNLARRTVLSRARLPGRVRAAEFSPCGELLAVAVEGLVYVYAAPALSAAYLPLHLLFTFRASPHHHPLRALAWSGDSRWLACGGRDLTVRVFYVDPTHGQEAYRRRRQYVVPVLRGHRRPLVGLFFDRSPLHRDGSLLYSLGTDSNLVVWQLEVDEDGEQSSESGEQGSAGAERSNGRWLLLERHYLAKELGKQAGKLCCVHYEPRSRLLVIGYQRGVFSLFRLEDGACTALHSLSVSAGAIGACALNPSGEWLALGAGERGQVLVWEWQTERYVLRQHGHQQDMRAVAYGPQARLLCTGGGDGTIRLWNVDSGFSYATLEGHEGAVTCVAFPARGGTATAPSHTVFSAGADGTVRAWDLHRYRQFRVMVTHEQRRTISFSCLAVDPAGEVVAAGSKHTYSVYVWSVQTGRLLDLLDGHEAPVVGLAFSPTSPLLCSASWDGEVSVWDLYSSKTATDHLKHSSPVIAVAYRPNGLQIATAVLNGELSFWNVEFGYVHTCELLFVPLSFWSSLFWSSLLLVLIGFLVLNVVVNHMHFSYMCD
jgi:periodic tryptophan protein 2